jgi:DNA-binding transcriptional MerR regulator
MPIKVDGKVYYKTSEAARLAGISRSTLLRWMERQIINETILRDRRGWRLFGPDDVNSISREAHKLHS